MTRADALRALLEKVEDGVDFTGHELNLAMDAIGPPYKDGVYATATYIRDAQRGSLDAAKALHEAVLPGWRLSISQPEIPEIGITFTAIVWPSERGTREHYFRPYAESETPARSWLIAILKALIATEDN